MAESIGLDTAEFLESEDHELEVEIIDMVRETLSAAGIDTSTSSDLAQTIYDGLNDNNYLATDIEYGREDINTDAIVRCSVEDAEVQRGVTDWVELS